MSQQVLSKIVAELLRVKVQGLAKKLVYLLNNLRRYMFELQHFPEPQSLSSRQLSVHFDTHSFVILQQINPSSQSTLESHRSRVVEYLMHTRNTKTTFNDKLDAILRSCYLTLLRLRLQLKMTFQKFYASYFTHVLLGRDNLHESPHGMLRKYARI